MLSTATGKNKGRHTEAKAPHCWQMTSVHQKESKAILKLLFSCLVINALYTNEKCYQRKYDVNFCSKASTSRVLQLSCHSSAWRKPGTYAERGQLSAWGTEGRTPSPLKTEKDKMLREGKTRDQPDSERKSFLVLLTQNQNFKIRRIPFLYRVTGKSTTSIS